MSLRTEFLDQGPAAKARVQAQRTVESRGTRVFNWEKPGLNRFERVIAFCEETPITKGIRRGKPMRLLPRQKEFIRLLYGEKCGTRRPYSLAIKSEPKGNGKTGLVSVLTLCHLVGPEAEDRGEVYSAAINIDQAGLLFDEMVATLREMPEYMACCRIAHHRKRIVIARRFKDHPGLGSTYAVLSKDAGAAHGLAPSLWIYDELAQTPKRELLDNLLNGMGKRDDSLGIVISTQAPSDSHHLSQLIDEGLTGVNPNMLVMLDRAPEDADPFAPETWRACNPALGVFLSEKEFEIAAARAKGNPAYEAAFRNYRLNQRVAPEAAALVAASVWKRCQAQIDEACLEGKVCIGGLDLAMTSDLAALVLAFPDDETPTGYQILPFFWTPLDKLKDRHGPERERFEEWIRRGMLIGIPGPTIRFDYIARKIDELRRKYKIKAIAYDNWRMADLKLEFDTIGMKDLPIQDFRQGFNKVMAPAVEFFQAAAAESLVKHNGNAVLTASILNAIVILDKAGNPMLDKSQGNRVGPARIDGAVALVMALGTARRFQGEPKPEFMMMFI